MTEETKAALEAVAAFLFERDQALGPYDDSSFGDLERLESARTILKLAAPIAQPAGDVIAMERRVLEHACEYVADALEAHEHSDGRDLLKLILAALQAPRTSATPPEGQR